MRILLGMPHLLDHRLAHEAIPMTHKTAVGMPSSATELRIIQEDKTIVARLISQLRKPIDTTNINNKPRTATKMSRL
jgi:hypothetical protein